MDNEILPNYFFFIYKGEHYTGDVVSWNSQLYFRDDNNPQNLIPFWEAENVVSIKNNNVTSHTR